VSKEDEEVMNVRKVLWALTWASAVAWLCTARIGGAQTCGNRVVEPPEECDDGGFCIGSENAGTACTSDADCSGGTCKTFGGDGCAANCTTERDVPYRLVPGTLVGSGFDQRIAPGTSGLVAYAFLTLPIALSGELTLTVGKERDGQIPVVVKADKVQLPPVEVLGAACGCVHGAPVKTCGGTLRDPDGSFSPDCTNDETVCTGRLPCAYLHGPGNTVSGVIGCNGLSNANLDYTVDLGGDTGQALPPVITLSGEGGPGSASLVASIGLDVVLGRCSGQGPAYGPDGRFCTADDGPPDASVNASNYAVTGQASTAIVNFPDGEPVQASVTGSPFSCSALAAGNPGGAEIVSAFAIPDVPTIGPVAVTLQLAAQPNETTTPACTGDCNGDGEVTVNEIITMVNVALGTQEVTVCGAGDANGDGEITVNEIVAAVNRALNGCE
jgi:hypothetical protein